MERRKKKNIATVFEFGQGQNKQITEKVER